MSDTRLYNLAFGRQNNFYVRTDNLFNESDTTPDVTQGTLFFTNNTTNTVITDLELTGNQTTGNLAGQFEGKVVRIFFLDGSTRLAKNNALIINGSNGISGQNATIELIYHTSAWYETGRSYNLSNVISVDSNTLKTVSNTFPNASTGNVLVGGRGNTLLIKMFSFASSGWNMQRAIGAEDGTYLTLLAAGDSHSLVTCNSAANDTFVVMSSASSTQFRLASSAAITFVKNNTKWHEITPVLTLSGGGSISS